MCYLPPCCLKQIPYKDKHILDLRSSLNSLILLLKGEPYKTTLDYLSIRDGLVNGSFPNLSRLTCRQVLMPPTGA